MSLFPSFFAVQRQCSRVLSFFCGGRPLKCSRPGCKVRRPRNDVGRREKRRNSARRTPKCELHGPCAPVSVFSRGRGGLQPTLTCVLLTVFRVCGMWIVVTFCLVCFCASWRRSRPYEAEKKSGWHPLMGSLEWFKEVGPLIKKTGESAPIECMQVWWFSLCIEVFLHNAACLLCCCVSTTRWR